MFRPRPARWFEVLCARTDSARVAGILARTGAVETEIRRAPHGRLRLRELTDGLARFRGLQEHYSPYWERARLVHSTHSVPPRDTLARALGCIQRWRKDADPLIDRIQALEDERNRITLCGQVMVSLGDSQLDFTALNRIGPSLDRVAALLPMQLELAAGDGLLHIQTELEAGRYLLAVGGKERIHTLTDQLQAQGARLLQPPPWLQGPPKAARLQILQHITLLERDLHRLYAELDRLNKDAGLPEALGDLSCLDWFTSQVGVLELASKQFALVSGWTDDWDGSTLHAALQAGASPALLHFPAAPADSTPPQLLDNPPWARPFEVFARTFGVPGGTEADPSPLLTLVVPLLFGYMFGDLGQGLVLLLAGWLLRKRFPLARLLMAAGASAAVFGLLFGSLFSLEHLIPALWLHPLEEPILVLALPLGFGVLLLGLGQVLNGLEADWRNQGRTWLGTDGGLLLAYLGAVLSLLNPHLIWLAGLGLLWYLAGHATLGGPWGLLKGMGELLERGLQLLVNTLSFARVGAFALAHAGLSCAMASLAEAAGNPLGGTLILVLGNLLIILLEGLVVSIQTTRLVLFEFFNRFLHGEGRVFRPLLPPPEKSYMHANHQP